MVTFPVGYEIQLDFRELQKNFARPRGSMFNRGEIWELALN